MKQLVEPECADERLDSASARLFGISRTAAARYAQDGCITVNGEITDKNYRLRSGDTVEFTPPEPVSAKAQPENIPVEIVYEDEYLAVVNKPKGMVVHPAPGHETGTLVSALMYHMSGRLSSINGVIRPGIVHRIDRDTSGLLLIAKTDAAHISLAEQIKAHTVCREYEGIAVGYVKEDSGVIDRPIGRHPVDRKRMAVTDKGSRCAVTEYEVISRGGGFTYMRFRLRTGRTHQIRVHMSSVGHPLAGDTVYGASRTKFEKQNAALMQGQCLHAKKLGFIHPQTSEAMLFDSPLPEYFITILEKTENGTQI